MSSSLGESPTVPARPASAPAADELPDEPLEIVFAENAAPRESRPAAKPEPGEPVASQEAQADAQEAQAGITRADMPHGAAGVVSSGE